MNREKTWELFKKARDEVGDMHALYRFAQLVELETLENAAKVCSEISEKCISKNVYGISGKDRYQLEGGDTASALCAFEIRNLKEAP